MRRLGELIAAHVPELAQTETNDSGQVIAHEAYYLGTVTVQPAAPGSDTEFSPLH